MAPADALISLAPKKNRNRYEVSHPSPVCPLVLTAPIVGSITLNTGASIGCGSALAINGAVTLDDNVIGGGCGSSNSTVPEPGTLGLLATGLAIVAGVWRSCIEL